MLHETAALTSIFSEKHWLNNVNVCNWKFPEKKKKCLKGLKKLSFFLFFLHASFCVGVFNQRTLCSQMHLSLSSIYLVYVP